MINLPFLEKYATIWLVCFVDVKENVDAYNKNFDTCCRSIAKTIANKKIVLNPVEEAGKLRRIFTGSFASEKSALQFRTLVEKEFNITLQMRKEDDRYRLYTGTFMNKANAYDFKGKVEKRFAVTLQIREE